MNKHSVSDASKEGTTKPFLNVNSVKHFRPSVHALAFYVLIKLLTTWQFFLCRANAAWNQTTDNCKTVWPSSIYGVRLVIRRLLISAGDSSLRLSFHFKSSGLQILLCEFAPHCMNKTLKWLSLLPSLKQKSRCNHLICKKVLCRVQLLIVSYCFHCNKNWSSSTEKKQKLTNQNVFI